MLPTPPTLTLRLRDKKTKFTHVTLYFKSRSTCDGFFFTLFVVCHTSFLPKGLFPNKVWHKNGKPKAKRFFKFSGVSWEGGGGGIWFVGKLRSRPLLSDDCRKKHLAGIRPGALPYWPKFAAGTFENFTCQKLAQWRAKPTKCTLQFQCNSANDQNSVQVKNRRKLQR